MNITEFLLARIAEDEAEAQVAKAEFAHGGYGCYGPARVLAECAAKRAIIVYSPPKTLQYLATVYAEHPDYQQEWAVGG